MDRVSIVQAKRELSRVVNKVAFGHEPVILTSRGRPKAVLIGHDDFVRLTGGPSPTLLRLGGLWKGTAVVTYRDLRALRRQVWGRLTSP